MNLLIVEYANSDTTIALMEDGNLTEYSRFSDSMGILAEQIYAGRVDRTVTGLQAAFVILSKNTSGFLPLAEGTGQKTRSLNSGDKVMVQVKKPPSHNKAAFLTREISLAGRYVMLLPVSQSHGVSHRITDEAQRAFMLDQARLLAPLNMGLVMRKESAVADEDIIRTDIKQLELKWMQILSAFSNSSPPALIWKGEPPVERALRDLAKLPDMVITNNASRLPSNLPCNFQTAESPLNLHNVQKKLEKSLRKHIYLKSGGTIVVDVCEALTVIDVNTGKFTGGKGSFEETILKINCEAACEAARILRLRKLSGIILFDFIDMESEESRNQVVSVLSSALSCDNIKTVIHGYTNLGILEITRKKTEQPIEGLRETICPSCHGTGVHREEGVASSE